MLSLRYGTLSVWYTKNTQVPPRDLTDAPPAEILGTFRTSGGLPAYWRMRGDERSRCDRQRGRWRVGESFACSTGRISFGDGGRGVLKGGDASESSLVACRRVSAARP